MPVTAIKLENLQALTDYRRIVIERARHSDHPDGYFIHGVTPEQWETQPGFTFSPSAGYIRSLLSGAA